MTETLSLRFTLDEECPISEYLEDGLITEYFPQDDGMFQVIMKGVDETLIESLHADELAEFFGLETEFVVACEVLD